MSQNPLNTVFLSPSRERLSGLLPVLVTDIYGSGGEFHPQGLYSTELFGALGSLTRMTKHSFIDIRTTVMHPKLFNELTRIKGLYKGIMSGSMYAVFDPDIQDFVKSDIIDGDTGYAFFMEHFTKIKFTYNDSIAREERIKLALEYKDKCMYRFIVVIPAGLRDISTNEENRVVEDSINALYRKLIRQANTVNFHTGEENNAVLNTVRWNLQHTFNDIYEYIESILSGKKGMLLSKWASRTIHSGTRNVITAMDVVPKIIGAPDAISINDTAVGLHQFMKAEPEISIYSIRNGPIKEQLSTLPATIGVVDPKTLQRKYIQASGQTLDKWGSEVGIEKLITGYAKIDARHKPIMIDGNYIGLIYRDGKSFRTFWDITELPEGFDKKYVRPITWTEVFYLSVYERAKELTAKNTRYPISTTGSIYPSFIYLQTTVKTEPLQPLDEEWKPDPDKKVANVMPITGAPFYDSMSIHAAHMPPTELNADLDGDVMSFIAMATEESVQETANFLYSKEAYLSADGNLRYGVNNTLSEMVLHNLTSGLEFKNRLEMRDITPEDKRKYLEMRMQVFEENKELYDGTTLALEEKDYVTYTKWPNQLIIGVYNNRVVGAIRFRSTAPNKGTFGISILKEFQSKGYGTALINRLESEVSFNAYKELYIEVKDTNKRAISLYTRLGYIVSGTSPYKSYIRMAKKITVGTQDDEN